VSSRAEAAPAVVGVAATAPRERARLLRFCVVGVANSAVTLAAFTILSALGCPVAVASALAFGAGAVNSFVANRRWTFGDLPAADRAWLRFSLMQGMGALASAAGAGALVAAGCPHLAAECATLPCVTVSLYCLSRLFVFRTQAS
jgi:putative flippase GtrA